MARTPLAMKQLITEITEVAEDAEFERSDIDGLGVYRTLEIHIADAALAEQLEFLLRGSMRTGEVSSFSDAEDHFITVQFVTTRFADEKAPFGVKSFVETASEVGRVVGQSNEVDDPNAVVEPTEQILYTPEDLKGKRTTSLVELVTTADPTDWDRDEIVVFLTTGLAPDEEAVEDAVDEDDKTTEAVDEDTTTE